LHTAHNHLIKMLARRGQERLFRLGEEVQLTQSEVLGGVGEPVRFVYFPIDAFISLITAIDGKPVLEVGMVGREGMCGAQVALNVFTQPLHMLVQGAGIALRIPIGTFRKEFAGNAELQSTLGRYLYVLMGQLASSAACARFHEISPRLARWLLMMQDRAHSDSFAVTHEFLGFMLGVRRVGITTAAGALQRKNLIEYRRGKMTVLNRKGLEASACGCYAADRQAYADVLQ
jgi:Crp-like helix-turn-helix domain